ncbi:MAG: DUF177 domain-containing protein [Deltaproteobacteria bacterium]|nr:DUF177 domain-containing protein [Deltaproteobacteria bacterium]
MRYDIKDIGEDGIDLDLALGAKWLREQCPDLELSNDTDTLHLSGRLESVGEDFLLRGRLDGELTVSCVRCLEPLKLEIDVDLTVSYIERKADAAGDDEEGVDDGDFALFSNGKIDLAPQLREELLLALPMHPGHEPACLGICAICGANRDRNPCDCERKVREATSPFSALGSLKH